MLWEHNFNKNIAKPNKKSADPNDSTFFYTPPLFIAKKYHSIIRFSIRKLVP